MSLTIVAVFGYLLLQFSVSYWASRRIHVEKDYLIAGRHLGLLLASFSLFASWFGAESVMGSSAAIARDGLSGSRADPFGYTLCLLLMASLIAYKMRAAEYVTLGDFFHQRYGRSTEILAVLLMIPTSLFWAAAQLLGFGLILSVMANIDVAEGLMFATLFVIAYTMLGGLLGDVLNDFIQGIVVIIGLLILTIDITHDAGGMAAAWARITPEQLRFSSSSETLLARLDTWMIPILGSLVAQEAMARLLATRSPRTARRACFTAAGLYLVVGLMPVVLGLVGTHVLGHATDEDHFIITLAQEHLSPALFVIFVGALLAAILSTIDTTLLSISSLTEHNLIAPRFPRLGERQKILLARLCVAIAGLAAYMFAVGEERIYPLLEAASSFGSAGLLVAVLLGLHTTFGDKFTANVTLMTGIVTIIAGKYLYPVESPFLLSVAMSLLVFMMLGVRRRHHRVHIPHPAPR